MLLFRDFFLFILHRLYLYGANPIKIQFKNTMFFVKIQAKQRRNLLVEYTYTYTVNIILRENALTSEMIGRNMDLLRDNGVSRAFVPARRCLFLLLFLDHRQEVPYGRI